MSFFPFFTVRTQTLYLHTCVNTAPDLLIKCGAKTRDVNLQRCTNIKSGSRAVVPWRVAAERWLWSCWWVMSIWTSGWGKWGICGCCWAGSAGRLRSRCEQCPSAPSSETPVPKQDHTQTHAWRFFRPGVLFTFIHMRSTWIIKPREAIKSL